MALILLANLLFEQALMGTAHFSSSWCQQGWPEDWELESFQHLFTCLVLNNAGFSWELIWDTHIAWALPAC